MVHSVSSKEELMDRALAEFRKAAARENRGRRGLLRRYSPALQARAVAYWRARRRYGERLRVVAAALGVAPWSLHRWMRAAKHHGRFHPVQVVTSVPPPAPSLVIELPTLGARVAGLDVETTAQLLTRLR
jgi:transposase-like protein